jgi:hypothetical protein
MKQQSDVNCVVYFPLFRLTGLSQVPVIACLNPACDGQQWKGATLCFVSMKRHIHTIYLWTRIPTCWLDFHQSQFCSLYEYGCSPSAQLPSHSLIASCVVVNPCECGFAHEDFLSSLFSPVRWRMCQASFLTKVGHHFLFLNCAGNKQYTHHMSVGAEGWELLESYFRILPVLKMLGAKCWRLSVGPSGRTALPCLRRSKILITFWIVEFQTEKDQPVLRLLLIRFCTHLHVNFYLIPFSYWILS